jgi:hypothetical protein
MYAIGHRVGAQGPVDRLCHLLTRHPDVEGDRLGSLVQPVEVRLEKDRMSVDHA